MAIRAPDGANKRIELAKDQPDVNHFYVRGGGQAFHLADKDGGHHQHCGQVHTQSCLKEEGLEEGGGNGGCKKKKGGKVCGHDLADELPFQNNQHSQTIAFVLEAKFPEGDFEHVHV